MIRLIVLAGTLGALALPTTAAAQDRGGELASLGKVQFIRLCANCHGAGGRGDGIIAEALEKKPLDLTRIAARRAGHFPVRYLRQVIDGREVPRITGISAMPAWGAMFAREEANLDRRTREARVRTRLTLLIAYLREIQRP